MINIAICDSKKEYIDDFADFLREEYSRNGVSPTIDSYKTRKELYKKLKTCEYDIIAIDANRNHMSNIKTVEKIRGTGSNARMAFISSSSDYVIEAYKSEPHRCLLKSGLGEILIEYMAAAQEKKDITFRHLSYKFSEGGKNIVPAQIVYVESNGHVLTFNMEESGVCYHLLSKLDIEETALQPYGFLRIHKSFLVNVKFVKEIRYREMELTMGIKLPIPKTKYGAVKKQFAEMKMACS
ncbi:MAG: LytTR family transcriptional regulator DNA-binding domain-containing protein [Lachnospiraceae bacterium]|jgi:DNA-binding LytR/AlgR family response regulator|nr:LytTR family transcriptional regulator DNA-binding domain-containing protein [Lachnospiraceae bacterium]